MAKLTRLQKFVIRNCGLLDTTAMAGYLRVSPAELRQWMAALGLPEMRAIESSRAFPIILRRNHDLLPEEEIAELLGMPVEKLRKSMQEMDFLDVKLGPKPADLRPLAKSDADFPADAAEHFRMRCGQYFRDFERWEQPFSFLDQLSVEEPPDTTQCRSTTNTGLTTRMMCSYTASHGDFLLTGEQFYTNGILSRLRNRGVNAAWMPGLLRDLAPSKVFEEFGEGHETRIYNLCREVERAAGFGIKLYMYLNEPRFMPAAFFDRYPDARGMEAHVKGHYGMCTSSSPVREWIRESARFLLSSVPDLGGVVLITASEAETNCFSHIPTYDLKASGAGVGEDDVFGLEDGERMCPRCKERGAHHVLTDTANLLQEAVESTDSRAEVIQWLWGWDYIIPRDTIAQALDNLPPRVKIMVDWAKYTGFSLFANFTVIRTPISV